MAHKQFMLDEQTSITVYKRKASRSLRLSITPKGQIRVSIPTWAPYISGVEFAKSRRDWIQAQRPVAAILKPGQAIGKAHRLHIVARPELKTVRSRVVSNAVTVYHPMSLTVASAEVQKSAEQASLRALRSQAECLLPQRLEQLANAHGFAYKSVKIKQLKSRWGSCDQQRNITLNLFLMQLPWAAIDYVLLHELTHTKVLRHGPPFWQEMEQVLPGVRQLCQELRRYQPILS